MLSIILYGRNDDHGTNYHKRIAISLNCLAEILTDENDEIIFVDCGTPDELLTIIEAIQDTLTEKTKRVLKVLRVRAPLVEPVARNIALRRSNPKNKWILSTNADVILIPRRAFKDLPDGFYLAPRFEIPETFWELSFDRMNPLKNIELLQKQKHFQITVRRDGFLKFDNLGDFQLMLREDLFRIGGFDERMIHGWHVDSNLCKRLSFLRNVQSLESEVKVYHCNHTRKESFLHSEQGTENDWSTFVTQVTTPFLSQPNWGLQEAEEIHLNQKHMAALDQKGIEREYVYTLDRQFYNRIQYPTGRVFPFLADHLYHLPKKGIIAYIGHNLKLFKLLTDYLNEIGFQGKIETKPDPGAVLTIFDFGFDEEEEPSRKKLKEIIKTFLKMPKIEGAKVIGINALRTDFQPILENFLCMRKSTFVPGLVYGFVSKKKKMKLKSKIHYFIVRFLTDYTDRILHYLTRRNFKIFKEL